MSSRTVHKRQLFHWIGKHIDHDSGLSAAQKRAAYVDALAGSLTGGLWMSSVNEELTLRGVNPHSLTRRTVCFTENRLSDCQFHASRYGHLGLGFPKRFVLDAGGKPVSYVAHKVGDLYTRTLLGVLAGTLTAAQQDDLDFIAHFVKPLRAPRKAPAAAPNPRTGTTGPPQPAPGAAAMHRQFGPPMMFHSEAEWRVVQHAELLKRRRDRFTVGPKRTHLKYQHGADLMTIVFPDARTQHEAQIDPRIAPYLRDPSRPPITMYHLQEIGEL